MGGIFFRRNAACPVRYDKCSKVSRLSEPVALKFYPRHIATAEEKIFLSHRGLAINSKGGHSTVGNRRCAGSCEQSKGKQGHGSKLSHSAWDSPRQYGFLSHRSKPWDGAKRGPVLPTVSRRSDQLKWLTNRDLQRLPIRIYDHLCKSERYVAGVTVEVSACLPGFPSSLPELARQANSSWRTPRH
jgi:hypothetical protein